MPYKYWNDGLFSHRKTICSIFLEDADPGQPKFKNFPDICKSNQSVSYMTKKSILFEYQIVESVSMLPQDEAMLVGEAVSMTRNAYAPYSEFSVGAAILLENGEVVKGSNQENGAYPSGLCAERVAAFAASAGFPGVPMKKIAICAGSDLLNDDEPVSPCGACRQVLLEYETLQQSNIRILLVKENGKILVVSRVEDLLPLSFTGSKLKKTTR